MRHIIITLLLVTLALSSITAQLEVEGRATVDRLSVINDTTSLSLTDVTLRKFIQSHGTIHPDASFTNYNNIDKVLILYDGTYKVYFQDVYRSYLPTCTVTPMTHSIARIVDRSMTSVTFELSDHTGVIPALFNYQCN